MIEAATIKIADFYIITMFLNIFPREQRIYILQSDKLEILY